VAHRISIPISTRWLRPSRLLETAAVRELRARQISDPVERLRYLRQSSPALESVYSLELTLTGARRYMTACGLLFFLLTPSPIPSSTRDVTAHERRLVGATSESYPKVWAVEQTPEYESYSNGLRIETSLRVSNRARKPFPIYITGQPASFASAPAGIVFHTTETHLAPFEAEENTQLKRLARNVIDAVRKNQSYHYLIDRFGRVFRVVEEGDVAFHAGWSIWADAQGAYVNLNESFLGVAFEAQTEGGLDKIQPAQIHAARVLTEMLRSRYRIPEANCVTHAQVSVNEKTFRIGYHTDWAGNFPFREIGLPDNYMLPVASMAEFGFEYDTVFVKVMGNRLWPGVGAAEARLREHSTANGVAASRWKSILQQRFRNIANQIVSSPSPVQTANAVQGDTNVRSQ